MGMRFAKYHGLGNDFVMIPDYENSLGTLPNDLVRALCDRRTGVGADGVIRIGTQDRMLAMDYYNADGNPGEMCGNGIRCLALLARASGRLTGGEHPIATAAGVKTIKFEESGVSVDMGVPSLVKSDIPMEGEGPSIDVALENGVTGTGVNVGNPHFVLFDTNLEDETVTTLGPSIEKNPAFPNRTNVEFVRVDSRDAVTMRVWERGVGETRACGTGACAVAVAAAAKDLTARQVAVNLPGGRLEIRWAPDDHVWMTGPALAVFEGELDAEFLRQFQSSVST